MSNKRVFFLTVIGLIMSLFVCVGCKKKKCCDPQKCEQISKDCPKSIKQYNFIVLLDLSDRISPSLHPNQVSKDKDIVHGVISEFSKQVKRHLYVKSKDKITVVVAPQATNYTTYNVSKSLRIDMSNLSMKDRRTDVESLQTRFNMAIDSLYSLASSDGTKFTGADIWSFFSRDLEHYLVADTNTRNILVVLTDGYLNFSGPIQSKRTRMGNKTSWTPIKEFRYDYGWENTVTSQGYGLIPIKRPFGNLEIITLEINPTDNPPPHEFDVIRWFWEDWYTQMGIKHFKCVGTQDNTQQTIQILRDFLNTKV